MINEASPMVDGTSSMINEASPMNSKAS